MIGITKLVFFIAFFKFIQSNYIQNTNIFPPYSECSNDGFIYAENFKCYKVFQRIQKLEDAVSICESHNSTVASLHSFLDKYHFINFLNKFNLRNEKIIIMSGYKCIDKHVCNWFDLSKFASLSSFPKCGNNKSPCFGFLINNLSTWACLSENEYYKGNNIGFVCEKNDNALKECKNSKYRRHGDGHCYRKILENQTFTSKVAQSLCEDDDANLPIIKNDIENMVINELSDNTGIHLGCVRTPNEEEKTCNCRWLDGSKALHNDFE
uniref:C-type lectin domain-containing protein n=1 Tax=Rhabditophanes sp. KR3021 TaxID=114890 RepID=A0AC35UHQ0_9BILA